MRYSAILRREGCDLLRHLGLHLGRKIFSTDYHIIIINLQNPPADIPAIEQIRALDFLDSSKRLVMGSLKIRSGCKDHEYATA